MKLIPAIDIRNSKCVRLTRGDFASETIYSHDPLSMALHWQDEGAMMLHVVDLDGAKAGKPMQMDVIAAICHTVSVPVQVGGGLRSLNNITMALEAGAARVVLGTSAIQNRDLLVEALSSYGNRIVVSLDTNNDLLATHGWQKTTNHKATVMATELAAIGVKCMICSDILRDGTLLGPNLTVIRAVQRAVSPQVELIGSGGVGKLSDLLSLCDLGLAGTIIGTALYAGTLDLAECRAYIKGYSRDR